VNPQVATRGRNARTLDQLGHSYCSAVARRTSPVNERPRILVVSETIELANNLLLWLREAGYDLEVVTTFSAGKAHLRTSPDMLITELKLREYNGLHLALRARRDGIPTAVIGASDPCFEEDAQQLGARYVIGDFVERRELLLLVERLLSTATTREVDEPSLEPEFSSDAIEDVAIGPDATWPISPMMRRADGRPPRRTVLH
jgi:CheY-like chemotaxis protein